MAKTTEHITLTNWTTIQQWATATNQLGDDAPLDDLNSGGTPGPHLVFENGIWKYPQQDDCGRFVVNKAARIMYIMADLGTDADWQLHVAGIDNSSDRPDNDSGSPYDAADAALYREGDIIVVGETSVRYVSMKLRDNAVVLPNQHVYITTTGADAPLVRLTFAPLYDSKE